LERKKKIIWFFFKKFYSCYLYLNEYSSSHVNSNNNNNNIDTLILSLFYQVTGYMTSDEIERMNTCIHFLYIVQSIVYIHILMQNVLNMRFLSHLPIYYKHRRKKKKIREKKLSVVDDDAHTSTIGCQKDERKKNGGLCIYEATSTSNTSLLLRM